MALGEEDVLVACCDTDETSAQKFGLDFKCVHFLDYRTLLREVEFDVAIVSVINKSSKPIVVDVLKSHKHVLVEKPLGRNTRESEEMLTQLPASGDVLLKTGFNHRFHPAIRKAKELLIVGTIGELFNIRAAYGHGGRPGMENEWRASKELCGGGELLDQGVHVIDLIRWFAGDVTSLMGKVETKFWEMEVEDNAYVIANTERGVTAILQVSWTNWRNTFSFEMFGTEGYMKVTGLGGSYGAELLEVGIRKKEGGRPDVNVIEFPPEDVSWREEWKEFKSAISDRRRPVGDGYDGLKANQVIDAIYRSSKENRMISI